LSWQAYHSQHDAQLPYGLKLFLASLGHAALHTDDLPNKEQTSDSETRSLSFLDHRIVISKDTDFLDSKRYPSQIVVCCHRKYSEQSIL